MYRTLLGVFALWLAGAACSGSTKSSDPNAGAGAGASSSGGSAAGSKQGGSNSGGSNSGGSSSGGSPAAPDWQAWAKCSNDDDCTVVKSENCCGCFPMGVHRDHEAEAKAVSAAFDASKCPPLGCASPPCPPDSMVACDTGICAVKPGCSERTEQDCESDELCQKYEARLCSNAAATLAYFACGKPKGACDDALTCVVDPFGRQVQFPDSCVPDGYTQACPSPCP